MTTTPPHNPRTLPLPTRSVAALATLLAALLVLILAPGADAFIYWTDGDTQIRRANPDGTGVERFIRAGNGGGVAVDAEHVYWGNWNQDGIGRANLNGTGVDHDFITSADFGSVTAGMAVDAQHVYWADRASTVARANLDGTGVDRNFITGGLIVLGVAVDAGHVYWSNFGTGAIGRANLDGTGVDQNFISGVSADGVAVGGEHVYWANTSPATIGRANLDGTGVNRSFIPGAKRPIGVAVDAQHIYWANQGGNTIGRANLDGTGVDQRFIVRASHPWHLALDALRSLSLGKAKTDKENGTARLQVVVPGSGTLRLAQTKDVKGAKNSAGAAGKVTLPVRPRGKAEQKLEAKGEAKVEAKVTYSPDGGDPTIVANTLSEVVKLVKRG